MMLGSFVWAATPPLQIIDLGAVEQFKPGAPHARYVELSDGASLPLWVTLVDGEWYVFNGRARLGRYWNCHYRWVPVNDRFEDPCSGFKWALTGELLTYPFPPGRYDPLFSHDLDRYPAMVENDRLRVNLSRLIPGMIRSERPPDLVCPFEFSCYFATPAP